MDEIEKIKLIHKGNLMGSLGMTLAAWIAAFIDYYFSRRPIIATGIYRFY